MKKPDRVFISHSALDREFVEREIVSLLTGHGIKVWYSQQDIRTASQWQLSIQQGLDQCDWFLVVMSPQSVESRWVRAEVHWALDERPDRVVPVLMEDCNWARLHLMMRTIQYVDLRGNLEDAKRRLLQTWGIQAESEPEKSPSRSESSVQPAAPEKPRPVKKPTTADESADVITNTIGMQLKLISDGEFLMGSKEGPYDNERPQHAVRITQPFYLGIHPVTQEEYATVTGEKPSHFKGDKRRPIESVNWFDAVNFCNALSDREKLDQYYKIKGEDVSILGGSGYRLPTEAEWEYACRAGTPTKWSCGDEEKDLEAIAWYDKNSSYETKRVGKKKPNLWGPSDMHGNVWEWCWDWYGEYGNAAVEDPSGPASGSSRVLRGGSFFNVADFCRSAFRYIWPPDDRVSIVGFRVSRTYN